MDLPGNNYLFPQHIRRTESPSDLVVWEDDARMVKMIELTICFESNFNDAQRRKTPKHAELLEEVEHSKCCGTLITIEVGSCGLLNMEGLDHLQKFLEIHNTRWAPFLVNVSQRAIEESHRIWTERNWRSETNT